MQPSREHVLWVALDNIDAILNPGQEIAPTDALDEIHRILTDSRVTAAMVDFHEDWKATMGENSRPTLDELEESF
jgi:hypothetical protein